VAGSGVASPRQAYRHGVVGDRSGMRDEKAQERMLQIGEVAELVGLSLRTIRHYDELGVVRPSGRSAGGFRLYTDADVHRLRLVKNMKPLDFSLEEMRLLVEARDRLAEATDPDEQAELRDRLELFALAVEERSAILRGQLAQAEELAAMILAEARSRTDR
jgi:MerR family copper efflux transcriptional regulator